MIGPPPAYTALPAHHDSLLEKDELETCNSPLKQQIAAPIEDCVLFVKLQFVIVADA